MTTTCWGEPASTFLGMGLPLAPAQTFTSEPTTGIFLDTPQSMGDTTAYTIVKKGTKRMRMDDTKTVFTGPVEGDFVFSELGLPDGSASAPSLWFESQTNSGLYYDTSASCPAWSTTGSEMIQFTPSTLKIKQPLNTGTNSVTGGTGQLSNLLTNFGNATSPAHSFITETNSGIYRGTNSGGTSINTCLAGTDVFTIGTGACVVNSTMGVIGDVTSTGTITGLKYTLSGLNPAVTYFGNSSFDTNNFRTQVNSVVVSDVDDTKYKVNPPIQWGTAAASSHASSPAYSFTGDTQTGLFSDSAGTLSITNAGTKNVTFTNGLSQFYSALTTGTNSMTCGAMTCSSLDSSGQVLGGSLGNSTAPALSFDGYSSTGLYTSGSVGKTVNLTIENTNIWQGVGGVAPQFAFGVPALAGTNSITSTSKSSSWPLKSNLWGDLSDGNITISINTNLTRDMYYNTLTINSSAQINTQGFRIYADTITGDNTGIIAFNGANASGTSGGVGITPVGTLSAISLQGFSQNGSGTNGGAINTNGNNNSASGAFLGGKGARGGDSLLKTAGTFTATNLFTQINGTILKLPGHTADSVAITAAVSGTGGAGGVTGAGGGGGACGGGIFISARSIGSVSVQAIGGNGASASDSTGGVGGGGGGGLVIIRYNIFTAGFSSSNINVSGGSNGSTGTTTNATTSQTGQYAFIQI